MSAPSDRGPKSHASDPTAAGGPAEGSRVVLSRILDTADQLRSIAPSARLAAFWDFDGTLLEGDCVDGYWRSDGAGYTGLVERAIRAGLCPAYAGEEGVVRCEGDFRELLRAEGKASAYAFQSRIFAGAAEAPLRALAQAAFETELGSWLFAEALGLWQALERAGVECWVLSASPDFFIKGMAAALGFPGERCLGMRLRNDPGGRLSRELAGPVMVGEGKTRQMQEGLSRLAAAEPGRPVFALAAFGNDRLSDGPMIDAVRAGPLPAGEPTGVLVNQPEPAPPGDAPVYHIRFVPRRIGDGQDLA